MFKGNPVYKSVLGLVAIFLFCSVCKAQDTLVDNQIKSIDNYFSFELFGNGGICSLNYERRVIGGLYFRIGIGLTVVTRSDADSQNTFPLIAPVVLAMPNYLFPISKRCAIEFGLGAVALTNSSLKERWWFWNNGYSSAFCLTSRLGLRYFSSDQTSMLGIAITPFIDPKPFTMLYSIGLYGGYAF